MASQFSQPQHEPALDRRQRRARGVFYTPQEIADWIVAQTYSPLLESWTGEEPPPRLLDPACGGGVFLQSGATALIRRCQELGWSARRQQTALHQAIIGIDIDGSAVATARQNLPPLLAANIHCADTLLGSVPGGVDAIVGNPPYVSIRELARSHSRVAVQNLRNRYRTAHGNFDLYVPFWERSLELLRPGGRLGFIVPNKWNTLDYARPLRELLLSQTTLEQILDLSTLRVFPQASTYPQVIILRKEPPLPAHELQFRSVGHESQLACAELPSKARNRLQSGLHAGALVLGNDIAVEERIATRPLSELCKLHSGASGYSAERLAKTLREWNELPNAKRKSAAEFIVSGNIDRYEIQGGNVRFLNRLYQRPCLPLDANGVSDHKRQLYREPKLVFSGMGQRLEAAYDEQGLALGVQVFAARDGKADPYYLLAMLNSKLMSFLFRERFAAKRLGGGYLAINKGQLAQLPVAIPDLLPAAKVKRITNLGRQLHRAYSPAVDEQLDQLIYDLFELAVDERLWVERSFEVSTTTRRRDAG